MCRQNTSEAPGVLVFVPGLVDSLVCLLEGINPSSRHPKLCIEGKSFNLTIDMVKTFIDVAIFCPLYCLPVLSKKVNQ